MTSCYNEIIVDICNSNIIIHNNNNVSGERESSRNQNSNPWPLTDGATDQTTEPLMSTKIQKTTFRESTSGYI